MLYTTLTKKDAAKAYTALYYFLLNLIFTICHGNNLDKIGHCNKIMYIFYNYMNWAW